jgi:hypothetical protein
MKGREGKKGNKKKHAHKLCLCFLLRTADRKSVFAERDARQHATEKRIPKCRQGMRRTGN